MNPFTLCPSPPSVTGPSAGLWLSIALVLLCLAWASPASAAEPAPPAAAGGDLQIEVTKKGLGKEVTIRKGTKEWYMLIEVTSDNTVVVRQEKDNETFLVDESETHDRSMTKGEVDTAIEDFITSVKNQVKKKK
jgi:hypothetical protein